MSVNIRIQAVDHGIPGGPLRRRVYPDRETTGETNLFLKYCPICGPEVPLDGQRKAAWHSATHEPEDFGLTPIGGELHL